MKYNTRTERGGTLPDEKIVELYWQRDEAAIDETDKKYKNYLYTIAYNILHNGMDCEECLDDTYLGVWNAIPPQKPSAFAAFISKITRNIALTRYEKNIAFKRRPSELLLSIDELDECIPSDYSVEEEYAVRELGRIISDYVNTLDERKEFVFVSRYYCFDKISDIAAMLHLSERTVLNDLSSIRMGLREALAKEGYYNE